jgi:NitT/TauT family transport system substrate-binding protein
MKKYLLMIVLLLSVAVVGCNSGKKDNEYAKFNLRLQWVPQAQFAGYIVAKEKGYYEEEGLDIDIRAAGPDLKPHITVANGTDDIGIGVPNQIITARSNGVPLTIIAQVFQDSPNRYVIKKEESIDDLTDLKEMKVGLWLGGDEAEFISMLNTVGMRLEDIDVIPQGFTVIPFLNGDYQVSQVTTYNELNVLASNGLSADKLQILSPSDYNSAIPGDMIFVKENTLVEKQAELESFLRASKRGWEYAFHNPDETVNILMKYNSELDRDAQLMQLEAVQELIYPTTQSKFGFMEKGVYENTLRVLKLSGQIESEVNIQEIFNSDLIDNINKSSSRK